MILTKFLIEGALKKLHPADCELIKLIFQIEKPDDWKAPWPPKTGDIGVYIGQKYEKNNKSVSEAAVRYRLKVIKEVWAGLREPLRRR